MNGPRPPDGGDADIICYCLRVTRGQLRRAIADGADSMQRLTRATGACGGCGTCRLDVQDLLAQELGRTAANRPQPDGGGAGNALPPPSGP